MVSDSFQNVFKPLVRIDALGFTGGKKGIHHGCAVSALVRTCEEVVLAAKRQRADSIFKVSDRATAYFQFSARGIDLR